MQKTADTNGICGRPLYKCGFVTLITKRRPGDVGLVFSIGIILFSFKTLFLSLSAT